MAWPLDQNSWEQDPMYGTYPANAFGLLPPFVPGIVAGGSPVMATGYETPPNPPINDAYLLGHHPHFSQQSHCAMSSASDLEDSSTSSPPDSVTGITNDPHLAVSEPPTVPASGHQGPGPRPWEGNPRQVTEYANIPPSPPSTPQTYFANPAQFSPLFSSDAHARPRPHATFECKWEGCRYSGSFSRKHELKRHLETKHIDPQAYPCPVVGCGKKCNREDNLQQHIQKRHGSGSGVAAQQERVKRTGIGRREGSARTTGTNERR
ncbi:hypothetical protein FQN54_004386 [Arachnomyces sp. PD_36]|nr:hypothetical protein FQN54_004386 [Arachnomyces sp. PD_36]